MKKFIDIKNEKDIQELMKNFNFKNSYIQNIHFVTGKSYEMGDDEPHTIMCLETKEGQILDLWFRNVTIMNYPSMINKNEIILELNFKFDNGFIYFLNHTNLEVDETNYKKFDNIFIKCDKVQYRIFNV